MIYCRGKFQLWHAFLLSTNTVLYIGRNTHLNHNQDSIFLYHAQITITLLLTLAFCCLISHISEVLQCSLYCIWITLFSIVPSAPIHVHTNGRIAFLKVNNNLLHIHQPTDAQALPISQP